MTPFCKQEHCMVPVPHEHRPSTEAEVAEERWELVIEHPAHCAWRQDIYDGCSCGVTGAVMELEDMMRERPA